jgi:hypothetical protein
MQRGRIVVVSALLVNALWLIPASAGLADWIFGDSFEAGTSAWSQVFGTFQVLPGAASEGDLGLRVFAASGESGWVQHDSDADEIVLRADFDVNADQLDVPTGESFDLYVGWYQVDAFPAFVLTAGNDGGGLGLRLTAFDGSANPIHADIVPLGEPGWHRVALEFGSETGPGGTGEARLFLDGALVAEIGDFDNQGVTVKSARLGFARQPDQSITGSLDVDVYTAVRLFDPWPCVRSSDDNPITGVPVCLDGEGRDPAIATGSCPDGLAVWAGAEDLQQDRSVRSRLGGIYGKKVSGASGRGIDNPTFAIAADDSAVSPDVAVDADCHAVVVWKSDPEVDVISAQVVRFDGTPVTPVVPVAASGNVEERPSVGVSDDGAFLIAWRREVQGFQTLWARHFASDRRPSADEFPVDSDSGAVSAPQVATNPSGDSVIVWEAAGVIRALLVGPSGQSSQYVTITPDAVNAEPAVAVLSDGRFLAVWIRDQSDRGVFLRRFDSQGNPDSEVIRVDSLLPGNCSEPQVEVGPDDRFVIVWTSLVDGMQTLRGRVFGSRRTVGETEFVIENPGRVWRPAQPRAAVAERLIFSFSEVTEPQGFGRGSLIGALGPDVLPIFADGFENGGTGAWSSSVP